MVQYEKRDCPETNVERTLTEETHGKLGKTYKNQTKKRKEKKKCAFTLTKVNVAKGTTPYLSPEPVLVPHSQLHGCESSLSPTDK